jgi:hypothetical protein
MQVDGAIHVPGIQKQGLSIMLILVSLAISMHRDFLSHISSIKLSLTLRGNTIGRQKLSHEPCRNSRDAAASCSSVGKSTIIKYKTRYFRISIVLPLKFRHNIPLAKFS